MDKNTALQDLRIQQRLQKMYPNAAVAEALHDLGYHSAHQIAMGRESAFVAKAGPKLQGLVAGKSGQQVAKAVYAAAQRVRSHVWSLALAQVPEQVATAVGSKLQQPDFEQGLPDYERLFGPMVGCDCADCQSIFGPGAYFVDLMNVVSEYITAPSAATVPAPFVLQYRRPDLWNLLIDCKNATTEVGYLEIVNAVLIANLSSNFLGGADPTEYLASASYPLNAPFNLPLEEVRWALRQLGTSLSAVYAALELPAPATAQAMLDLSPEQYALVTDAVGDMPALTTLYGFHDPAADVETALGNQALFLERTGMEPAGLEAMVYQNLRQSPTTQVVSLNGQGYLDAGKVQSPDLLGNQTVEFWVFPEGSYPPNRANVLGKSYSGELSVTFNTDGTFNYYFGNWTKKCNHTEKSPNPPCYIGTRTEQGIPLDQWTHVALVRDLGKKEFRSYFNGKLVGNPKAFSAPDMEPVSTTCSLWIGNGYVGMITGKLAEVRIWKTARTPQQIMRQMNRGLGAMEMGDIAAYWPLGEGSGNVAHDKGSHGFHATFSDTQNVQWESLNWVPFSESEIVPGLIDSLFINQVLGTNQYLYLQGREIPGKWEASLGIMNDTTPGPLTATALYQIAQMKRLQQQTGWKWADLDWALKSVSEGSTTIAETMIVQLGKVQGIVEKFSIPLDEACALWYDMKTYGRGNGALPEDLWDRVWNTPPLMANDTSGNQPPYYRPEYDLNPLFTSPVITMDPSVQNIQAQTAIQASVCGALKIHAKAFQALLGFLKHHQVILATETAMSLDVQTMSILYRYTRLAKMLDMGMEDFLQLTKLLQLHIAIWTVDDVVHISETAAWLRKANISVSQLGYLLTGALPENARPLLNAQNLQQAIDTVTNARTQAMVRPDSFVTDAVDAAKSQAIFDQLAQDGFIDVQGLVLNEVALTVDNVYRALTSGAVGMESSFFADPTRRIAQLQNSGSTTCGTIQFTDDPFSDATIQDSNHFTLAFWMNSAVALSQTWPGFVGWNQGANNTNVSPTVTQVQSQRGQLGFSYSPQAGGVRTTIWLDNFIHEDNEWIHVAWVVNNGTWSIYRNGTLFPGVDVTMATSPYLQQPGLEGYPIGYQFGNILNGAIANVGLWNTVLSERDVRKVMADTPAVASQGLIGYWPINEGSGTTIYDQSGVTSPHNGTLQGSYEWQVISHLPAGDLAQSVTDTLVQARDAQFSLVASGLAGHLGTTAETMLAICDLTGNEIPLYSYPTFDGQGNYMEVPYAASLNAASFTIALFAMPTGNPDTDRILLSSLDLSNPASTAGYQISLNAQNQVVFITGNGTASYNTLTSDVRISANLWASIVATYSDGTMKLAVNSRNIHSLSVASFMANATESLYVAAGLNASEQLSGFFEGHMVQVMVGDAAVSKHVAMVGYGKLRDGKAVTAENLTAWWPLNQQPASSTVVDQSGNGNDGTLEGSITYTPYPANELLNLAQDSSPNRPRYLLKLAQNVQLAKLLRLTATEVQSLQSLATAFGTENIGFGDNNLSLPQLQTLTAFKAMTKAWGDTSNQTLAYLALAANGSATSAQIRGLLALITGWSQHDISTLLTRFQLQEATTVTDLRRMAEVMAVADTTGMSLDGLQLIGQLPSLDLVNPPNGDNPWQTYLAAAQVAQSALRAQGSGPDATRIGQTQSGLRDRLAAWLMWELNTEVRGMRTLDDLYEYLLIDVKMSPEVKTSYLVSAMNSVQLYVNRCYNNLEPGVVNEVPPKWWEWMSTYRVWQANREVYLFPENYVDPSLRKLASPQFKTLLNAISKSQITEDNVAQAYSTYLEDIKDLGTLVLVDAYTVAVPENLPGINPDNRSTITYIAGRTQASPPKYYLRKMLTTTNVSAISETSPASSNSNLQFGPWEEIGLSIHSQYVTIGQAESKLYLFWVQQTKKTFTPSGSDGKQAQAVYATLYYSYRSLQGNWAAPLTLKTDVLIGFDEISFNDLHSLNPGLSLDLLTNLGMWSENRVIPYFREKPWNKVQVFPIPDDTGGLIVQFGAIGMPSGVSNGSVWSNAESSPSDITTEERVWQRTCIDATNLAYRNQGSNMLISFLPAYVIGGGAGILETPLLIQENENLSVLQSGVVPLWSKASIGMFYGANIAETSYSNTIGNLCSAWPLCYTNGTVSGTYALDVISGYNGTLSGTTTVTGLQGPYHGSEAWMGLKFVKNTAGSSSKLPLNAYYGQNNFTVSFVFQTSTLSNAQYLASFMFSNSSKVQGWALGIDTSGNLWLYFGTNTNTEGGFTRSYPSNVQIAVNEWYHIVLAVSNVPNNPSYISINGSISTLNPSQYPAYYPPTPSTAPTQSNPIYLTLGSYSTGMTWGETANLTGVITNVKYWDTALSSNDAVREYAATLYPMLTDIPKDHVSSQGVGNAVGSALVNIAGQGYFAYVDQALPTLGTQVSVGPVSGALEITCLEPSNESAMALPFSTKLVRMGTQTLPTLMAALSDGGMDALMQLPFQYLPEQNLAAFYPNPLTELPSSTFMDFNSGFGPYFWEMFFYAPYLIAEKLRSSQRFAEAQRWYKYIFDPTALKVMQAYWPLGSSPVANTSIDIVGGCAGTNFDITTLPAALMPFSLRKRDVYDFNGTSSYVQVPTTAQANGDLNYPTLNPPQFTLSVWVYISPPQQGSELPEWQSVVTSRDGGSDPSAGYILYVNTEGTTSTFQFWTGSGSGWIHCNDTDPIVYAQWYHVACTFDGLNMNLYVDGGIRMTVTNSTFNQNLVRPLRIGAGTTETDPSLYFGGMISDVGLWNSVLSAGEVANLYEDYKYQRLTNRFWRFAPFRRLNAQSLYHILRGDPYESTYVQPSQHYTAPLQMAVYEYDPFDPDAIARLRVNSYQKAIFMRFIQNLVAWGDALFTQNTWETLTDATMNYVLASDLLGKLPVKEVTVAEQSPASYQDMVEVYAGKNVPDFLIDMEATVAGYDEHATLPEQVQSIVNAYFCIPTNGTLLSLWETVADRLFKLRHGLTLTGQPNVIPLFAPPIDPAALVAAAAAGVSLQVAGNTPSVPAYRFSYLIQQAKSLTGEVQRLGNELLAALEKQDAEQLAEMQAGYQVTLTQMSLGIKAAQVNQLQATEQALQASLRSATYVHDTYLGYIKHGLNAEEIIALASMTAALLPMAVAEGVRIAAAIAYLFPNTFGLANGGMQFGDSVNMGAVSLEGASQILNAYGQLASTMGQYIRRTEDWALQKNIASYQMQEINAQIRSNQFALEAAKNDYALTQTQYQQSQEVQHFLTTKFTNVELYQWMAGQVSSIYFQMYQLAYAMAQSAQVAFQYELNSQQNFLNPAAWNSLYQGLLAGDTLSLSLEQMESAYVGSNTRKLAVRKTYSLRQNDPLALLQLVETGSCTFELGELLYDLDFPGQYNRKIKTLSVSIPAVVGPYQNIHATLVQTHNTVVTKPSVAAVEYLVGQNTDMPLDGSIRSNWNPGQEIVISTGVNDSGMFQVNLDDPQYLPFEGTGAVSGWALSIPQAANGFSLRSISDVILTVEYTAQDGGMTFKNALTSAITGLNTYNGLYYLSLRQLFSGAWFNFLSSMELPFEMVQQMFPQNLTGTITLGNGDGNILLFPILAKDVNAAEALPPISLNGNAWSEAEFTAAIGDNQMVNGKATWTITLGTFPTDSPLLLPGGKINPAEWLDIALVVPFSGGLIW